MSDSVQQTGGGEQITPLVADTKVANLQEPLINPTEKPPAHEQVKKGEAVPQLKADEVQVVAADMSKDVKVDPTTNVDPEPALPPQDIKDIKQKEAPLEPQQNGEAKQDKDVEINTNEIKDSVVVDPAPDSTDKVNPEPVAPASGSSDKVVPVEVAPAPETSDKVPPVEGAPPLEPSEKANPTDIAETSEPSSNTEQAEAAPKDSGDWQIRESELLKKIEELEKIKNARSEDGMKLELKLREEEIDLLKARVRNLETELQAALSKPGGKNHELIEGIKQQHEELLSKARGMIFDKTKMVKNQELQIEALTTQVQSLKDINQITKDLLEIRNSEVKAMEDRFQAMEARFKAEKERYDLVLKRAQTSTNINDDLRKEYETQLAIFKELREKYELRVQALVAENNRLKEAVKGPGASQ